MYLRASALQRATRTGTRRWRPIAAFLGPSFVVAVAYVDPGNLATNVTAGSGYGFTLLWVIVVANVIAMLVQYLSAKLASRQGGTSPNSAGRPTRAAPLCCCGCRRRSSSS